MDPQVSQPVPYSSNPFRPLLDTLGKSLTINGIAALELSVLLVVVGIVLYALAIGGLALINSLHAAGIVIDVLLYLALAWFVLAVVAGFIKLLEDSSQGVSGSWKAYFGAGRPYALRLLGLAIVSAVGLTVAFVILVIPGVYLLGRWSLAAYVMVQENLGVFAALRRSWRLSRGHVWEVLGSLMAGALLGSNGLLAGLVGPSALVGRLEQLRDLEAGKVSKPKLHWLNWAMPLLLIVLFGAPFALAFWAGSSNVQTQQNTTFDQLYQQNGSSGTLSR